MTRLLVLSIILLGLKAPAQAQPTLKVGDPAPPLAVGQWLKGEPIKQFEPGKVYVVECWATWCAPCVAAIPHLTRLQARYKDNGVMLIAVNVWENDPTVLEPFMKRMSEKMGYAVAVDDVQPDQRGKMVAIWLQPAGQTRPPCAFLIDRRGKIAWIGPTLMMDRPLDRLAKDQFNPAEQVRYEAQLDALFEQYVAATKAKDLDKALAALDQLSALNPFLAPQYGTTKLSVLIKKGQYSAANALASAVADDPARDDQSLLATIANTLLNAPEPDRIDAALAIRLAATAYEANGSQGWQYSALLARAYAANGQFNKAVELQTQAVRQAPQEAKEREQKTLEEYQEKAQRK
jgi:thiol-disulfide isomerase/thioredoxin